jgi:transposase
MSEPATITSPHAPDVEDVRQWMLTMIKAMRLLELVAAIIALVTRMRDINTELTRRMANMRRKRPRSETLARVEAQLAFAFAAWAAQNKEPATGGEPSMTNSGADPAKRPKTSRKGRHPGRAELPSHLERVPEVNPVPPGMRICPLCGTPMTTVDHSICEILDVRPAELFVRQRLDERVACPNDDTIVSAPTPPELVERGKLGTTLIVESLADKYLEHQPIERQCLKWSRAGVDIAPQTLGRSVGAAIDTLAPVAKMIEVQTRAPGLLATDATGIPVLDQDAPDGIRTGTMWCWTNAQWVTFFYSPEGDSDSVRRFLGEDLRRSVQCDGTNITSFLERVGGQRPGCWSHARRGLVEAARGGDKIALEGLRTIAQLFAIERQSRLAGETADQRLARRLEHSKPLTEELRSWIDDKRATVPPKTPLGAALGYLHRQWKRLVLFLTDGNIELTNNGVERELRKLVLGRRNWLFTWEDLGGERTASILTIVGTCVAHGVNPRAYLHLVTKLIVNRWPHAKLRELLPDRLAVAYPDLLVRDGTALRSPTVGLEDPVLPPHGGR